MFWNRKTDDRPLGVPLGELLALLAPTSLKASIKDRTLLVRHEHHEVRVDVLPPAQRESANGPIRAVVHVIADLPAPLKAMAEGNREGMAAALNAFAALGAMYVEGDVARIGSRLTVYEAEDAWRTLHLPLLLMTVIAGAEPILGGWRRTLSETEGGARDEASAWHREDFGQVGRMLSRLCVCNHDERGLTAEFGLREGSSSAMTGDHETALFQLRTDEPHPALGGGLLCLLQMPHRVDDEHTLQRLCNRLNAMEMAPHDLPPHFGAWCPGRLGDNLAYATFLPNGLHAVPGIAMNVAVWAMHRALWANGMLLAMGQRV